MDSLDKPTIMVYNKIDRLDGKYPPFTRPYLPDSDREENEIFISAEKGIGITDLIAKIKEYLKGLSLVAHPEGNLSEAWLFLDNANLDLLPSFYKMGVVTESRFEGDGIRLKIRGKTKDLEKIRKLNGKVKLKLI